jgi:hypothetical protein
MACWEHDAARVLAGYGPTQLGCENVASGTKSPQTSWPRHREEVCVCSGGEKELFKIEGTKLECL